mmetsp:Transcript_122535/g.342939  ORF Transcript_122535/g.342939 Transcript_122535/m.342939 type:complete len:340 (-) Transcript_122535:27-1046(-)
MRPARSPRPSLAAPLRRKLRSHRLDAGDGAIVAPLDAPLLPPPLVLRVWLLHPALAAVGEEEQRGEEEHLRRVVVLPAERPLDPSLQDVLHEILKVGDAPQREHGPAAEDPDGDRVLADRRAYEDEHHDGQHAAVVEEVVVGLDPRRRAEDQHGIREVPRAATEAKDQRRVVLCEDHALRAHGDALAGLRVPRRRQHEDAGGGHARDEDVEVAYGRGADRDHDDEGAEPVLAAQPLRQAVLPAEGLEDVGEGPAEGQRRAAEGEAAAPEELRERAQAEPEDHQHAQEPSLAIVHPRAAADGGLRGGADREPALQEERVQGQHRPIERRAARRVRHLEEK